MLDPRSHAVRADLADVRLADQVFAPHYVAAVEREVASAATLRSGRDAESEALALLTPGDRFELLDQVGDTAWGRAPTHDLVGYVPLAVLA